MREEQAQFVSYLNYLRRLIDDESGYTYQCLTRILFDRDFYYTIAMDSNRDFDGRELRYDFLEEMVDFDYDERDIPTGPARVLEVLIALAQRMEFHIYDPKNPIPVSVFFFEMVENLGLIGLDDATITDDDVNFVHNSIDIWMDRRYNSRNNCRIFPVSRWPKGSRSEKQTELWYQMMYYIQENYPA